MQNANLDSGSRLNAQGEAVFTWFQKVTDPPRKLTLDQLADGREIWKTLRKLDSQRFQGNLPEDAGVSNRTGKWIQNWQNLKHIYKPLAQFVTEKRGRLPNETAEVDLKAIARCESMTEASKVWATTPITKDFDTDTTFQLLKMVLFVAVNTTRNERYIKAMSTMPTETQMSLQNIITDVGPDFKNLVQEADRKKFLQDSELRRGGKSPSKNASTPSPKLALDQELHYEEQLSTLEAKCTQLRQEQTDTNERLREVTQRHDRLLQTNSQLRQDVEAAATKLKEASTDEKKKGSLTDLNAQIQGKEDHIKYQERLLTENSEEIERLKSQVVDLQEANNEIQVLKDELDETRKENQGLMRTANTIKKYTQKLESFESLKREVESLKAIIKEQQQAADEGQQAAATIELLERQLEESRKILPRLEGERWEQTILRQRMELEQKDLQKALDAANAQHVRDHETINELVEKSRSLAPTMMNDLETELENGIQRENNLQAAQIVLMWSRLTYVPRYRDLMAKYQQQVKTADEVTMKNASLQQTVDDATSKNRVLHKKFVEVLQDRIDLQRQLDNFKRGEKVDGVEKAGSPSTQDELRKEWEAVELAREKKLFQPHPADRIGRELFLPLGFQPTDAVIDAMAAGSQEHDKEFDDLKRTVKELEAELNEARSTLRNALGTTQSDEDADKKLKEALELLKSAANPTPEHVAAKSAALEKHIAELAETFEDSRQKLRERTEVHQKILLNDFREISLSGPGVSQQLPVPIPKSMKRKTLWARMWSANQ